MAAHGLPLSSFPPRVPLWPGLLLGTLLAGGAGIAHVAGHWPVDLPVPPGHHLHPVALFGHGFAFAVAFTLFLEWLRLRPRRVELKTCDDRARTHWASAAISDCLSVLPAKCTLKSYERKLIDYQARWARPARSGHAVRAPRGRCRRDGRPVPGGAATAHCLGRPVARLG